MLSLNPLAVVVVSGALTKAVLIWGVVHMNVLAASLTTVGTGPGVANYYLQQNFETL